MRITEIVTERKLTNDMRIPKIMEGFFDWFKSKPPEEIEPPEFVKTFIKVTDGFSFISFVYKGDSTVNLGVRTETVQDAKFALEELKVLKQAMQLQKKEYQMQAQQIRQDFSQRRANRGAMIPGGGKFGTFLRYGVRSARASERGRIADQLQNYNDIVRIIDSLLQSVAQTEIILKKEIITGKVEPIVKSAEIIDSPNKEPIAKKKTEPTEKPIAKKKTEPAFDTPKTSTRMADLPVSVRHKAKAGNPNLR